MGAMSASCAAGLTKHKQVQQFCTTHCNIETSSNSSDLLQRCSSYSPTNVLLLLGQDRVRKRMLTSTTNAAIRCEEKLFWLLAVQTQAPGRLAADAAMLTHHRCCSTPVLHRLAGTDHIIASTQNYYINSSPEEQNAQTAKSAHRS